MIVSDKKSGRKGKTFSLAELNERLKKLREMDEKEAESNASGFQHSQLRESLIKLQDDDKTQKGAAQRINVFAQLGGTPSFMLSPPKEELVEKLGGLNSMLAIEHSLSIPVVSKAPTIILGMDVSHGSPDNVPPGTVIDNKVFHPRNNDFYMCAHAGMIRTTRPTHYHVLYDEIGFSADDLQ